MKTTTSFWRNWWNELGKNSKEDFEADRGTTLRINELEQRAERQFIKAVDLKPTDIVLDAGCGTGVNFSKITGMVAEVVGMDISEEMLKRARRRINEENIQNVSLLVGNMTQIQFPAATFDKVICTSVLQYLNDDECEAALEEMIRVCKKSGIIVIHAKNRTSLYGLSRMLLQFIGRVIGRKTTSDYYRQRIWYERAIRRLGWQIADYDSFGILTFVPLPKSIVRRLLQLEMAVIKGRLLKKYGVNYKMTVRVD